MAKKQTRRSISVSRGTYERLKAYCETNKISMSQFVERRVGDFLGRSGTTQPVQPATARVNPPVPAAKSINSASIATNVRADAFEVPVPPLKTPTPRMSDLNQPLSQPVGPAEPVIIASSDEPMLKDPDAKLTADQIFTF